jgi:hypothetical protein
LKPCPNNPPPPEGFRIWRGAVPEEISNWAKYLLNNELPRAPYGTTWGMTYSSEGAVSQPVVARRDHHSWTFRNGKLITGICVPGITVFQPLSTIALASYNPATDNLDAPDPTAAVFPSPPEGPSWSLVAASAAAAGGVVLLFWLALKGAGRAVNPRKRLRR